MTIIFSAGKTNNLLLLLFRPLFHKYNTTHVSFGIEKDGKPYVFHMTFGGAVRTPREKFLVKSAIVKEYKIVPDLSNELKQHLNYLGTRFDHLTALMHMVTLLFRPIKQLLIFYKIRNSFYCANFARQLDKDNKVKAWRKIDKSWASIDELQEACENSPEFEDITISS